MRKLAPTYSLLTYLEDLEYTEAALGADEAAADLAAAFTEEIEGWSAIFKAEREARRAVTRADAVIAVKNAALDGTTTRFGAAVLAEAGADRRSPLFKRFFSVAPSEVVRKPLRKQAELTLNVMITELAKVDAASPLKAFAAPLQTLAKAALDGLDARAKLQSARGIAAHDVAEWKEGANTLRLSTYAELLKRSTTNARGRAWVEAFFRADGASATEEAAEGDVPAPTPPA